jgi:hypothetical protein
MVPSSCGADAVETDEMDAMIVHLAEAYVT